MPLLAHNSLVDPLANPGANPMAGTLSPPSALPSSPSVGAVAGRVELIDAEAASASPTSFGVFKPVGHVMVGLPAQGPLDALVAGLHDAGWPAAALRQFSPSESAAEFQAMVDNAGVLAGLGYEIHMLERYIQLDQQGYRWLLIQADDAEHAESAAQIARGCGATLAVYYRTLAVQDLIV